MSAALVLDDRAEYLVPEERALQMIDACARQIEHVATIPDVKKVITQADAIAAVMSKIKASDRAKRAALALRVEAEAQLGRITKQIPHGRRGGAAQANPGQHSKRKALNEHRINHFRASVAEKLSAVPVEDVDRAIDRAKQKTVYGVTAALGLRQAFSSRPSPRHPMRKLAHDAIGLLVQCQTQGRPPTVEEVGPLREMFTKLDFEP